LAKKVEGTVDVSKTYFNERSKEDECGSDKKSSTTATKSRVCTNIEFLCNKSRL